MSSKACKKCGEVKPLTAFQKCAKAADGRVGRCYVCAYRAKADRATPEWREAERARTSAWRVRNPDKERAARVRQRQVERDRAQIRRAAREAEQSAWRADAAVERMDAAVLKDIQKHLHVGTW